MRVLVTGAAGFIGSHVTEALIARGDEVIGLDNFDPQYGREIKMRNLADALANEAFELVEGDIRSPDTLTRIMQQQRPSDIVHLAAKGGVRESIEAPEEYLSVNVEGTLRVLQAAARAGVKKLVFASSSSVYGPHSEVPFREDQPLGRPGSPYGASKIAAEAYCHVYHHLHGLPVIVARLFNVVGPRQRPELAISKFVRLMLRGEPIPVYGDGSTSRDYTHVGDIVAGILAALGADLDYEVINLGHSQPVLLRDLIFTIEDVLGIEAKIERLPDQPGDLSRTYADIEKAKRLLNWEPTVPLRRAVEEVVQQYESE